MTFFKNTDLKLCEWNSHNLNCIERIYTRVQKYLTQLGRVDTLRNSLGSEVSKICFTYQPLYRNRC